jgi:chemotaxis protein methyltransferase CheR
MRKSGVERLIDEEYVQFIQKIKRKFNIDLGLYKENQMNRRLRSLYKKRECRSYDEFYELIVKNENVKDEFLDRITINVTEFFRNSGRWDVLKETILPELIKEKNRIKCWSAACSTGEEPYSLAMIFKEMNALDRLEILATDLDQTILEKAKNGVYTEKAVNPIEEKYKKNFNKIDRDMYEVNPDIKKPVHFETHDLLKTNYQKGFDLIICRNVMIYFTEEAKDDIYLRFNQALNPGGYLFVGSTEQIFRPEKFNFKSVSSFFYQKNKTDDKL